MLRQREPLQALTGSTHQPALSILMLGDPWLRRFIRVLHTLDLCYDLRCYLPPRLRNWRGRDDRLRRGDPLALPGLLPPRDLAALEAASHAVARRGARPWHELLDSMSRHFHGFSWPFRHLGESAAQLKP